MTWLARLRQAQELQVGSRGRVLCDKGRWSNCESSLWTLAAGSKNHLEGTPTSWTPLCICLPPLCRGRSPSIWGSLILLQLLSPCDPWWFWVAMNLDISIASPSCPAGGRHSISTTAQGSALHDRWYIGSQCLAVYGVSHHLLRSETSKPVRRCSSHGCEMKPVRKICGRSPGPSE